jgi:LacI family transcriptional regulator
VPDAVFCAADGIALGCLDELKQRGIAVPTQVSVVGFDDNVLARAAGLTSVRQPLPDLGRQAVNQLLDEQGGVRDTYGRPWVRYLHMPTALVMRETLIERAAPSATPKRGARKTPKA